MKNNRRNEQTKQEPIPASQAIDEEIKELRAAIERLETWQEQATIEIMTILNGPGSIRVQEGGGPTENLLASLAATVAKLRNPPPAGERTLPATMTPEIAEVLGLMVYNTGPIARSLRLKGHKIEEKAEVEQAHVLWWALALVLKHGAEWKKVATAELLGIVPLRG